jgi:rubrerythrin
MTVRGIRNTREDDVTDETRRNETNKRIDDMIQRLIEADQRGTGIEPMKLAHELGELKLMLARRKTILPRPGGEGHWRCEACGTISHASAKPDRCPECGATQLWPADLAQPNVESGAG